MAAGKEAYCIERSTVSHWVIRFINVNMTQYVTWWRQGKLIAFTFKSGSPNCLFKSTKQDEEDVYEIRAACVFFGLFFTWKHMKLQVPSDSEYNAVPVDRCVHINWKFFITNYLLGPLGFSFFRAHQIFSSFPSDGNRFVHAHFQSSARPRNRAR